MSKNIRNQPKLIYVSAYTLPETFASFLDELEEACADGDRNSMERLAPQMAAMLKDDKQWDNPSVPLEDKPSKPRLLNSLSDLTAITPDQISALIERELGALTTQSSIDAHEEEEYSEALANMLIDIELSGNCQRGIGKKSTVRSVLRGLQPQSTQEEQGLKICGRRTCCRCVKHCRYSVEEFQFWTLKFYY